MGERQVHLVSVVERGEHRTFSPGASEAKEGAHSPAGLGFPHCSWLGRAWTLQSWSINALHGKVLERAGRAILGTPGSAACFISCPAHQGDKDEFRCKCSVLTWWGWSFCVWYFSWWPNLLQCSHWAAHNSLSNGSDLEKVCAPVAWINVAIAWPDYYFQSLYALKMNEQSKL